MPFHSYSLFVEGHTHARGYEFIPILGPMEDVSGPQRASVARVLALVEAQREPLQAALSEMHQRGATGISMTMRLPVAHEPGGGEVKGISAEGDLVANINARFGSFTGRMVGPPPGRDQHRARSR